MNKIRSNLIELTNTELKFVTMLVHIASGNPSQATQLADV